jgi:SPP1 gp7 family putative phage head morphogenesis protein
MGGILKGRTMEELERQAGILGKTIRNNAKKAHAIVNGSFHNGTFSDRIWQYQDLMREDLGRLLQTGLIQGKNPREIASGLKKYWFGNDPRTGGGATYCMERLMRTELARVQTEAQKQSFVRNGFDMYMFICNEHRTKSGTCDICQGLNGKTFKIADMMPGDNAPPVHPNCRCATAPYEDNKEYRAWLRHLEQGGTTEEWNKLKGIPQDKPKDTPKAQAASQISDTDSFDTLDEYLKKAYDISVDKSVKLLDFGCVRDALSGLESVFKKVRGLADTVKHIKTGKSGVMSCSGENITFNPYHFEKSERILQSCKDMSERRWWVKNASSASIGAHECAHSVEWLMLQKNKAYSYEWQRIDAWNKCTEAKKVVSQACKNIKKTPFGKGKRNAELISSISKYAQETASETMAEAFADIYANGENASPLSLEIERLTLELLSTYERG